jgi:hypothetical protein
MTQASRTQQAIQFWGDRAQALAAELHEMTGRLAQAQLETEVLRAQLDAAQAAQASQQEDQAENEKHIELDLLRHLNAGLQERLDALTTEWEKQSQQLMQLSLENERLKGGEVLAAAPTPQPAPGRPKRNVSKGLRRDCKTCGNNFEVTFRNRLYCGDACAPLLSNGEPRRRPTPTAKKVKVKR